ncbi:MAG: HNH endonuclease signature motif containing protein [Pseudohongiella sp.]|nr:HNH endonuclease signature motif containing protein [Pseudohongiella sp.]
MAELAFLEEGYKLMTLEELTFAFNEYFKASRTLGQIRSCIRNHKFTCGRTTNAGRGRSTLLSAEQHFFTEILYKEFSIVEVTQFLNDHYGTSFTAEQLKTYTTNHQLKAGRTGCFEKGLVPWNTGTKGVVKPNSGNFRKGSMPVNTKPLGHERICSKDGYILVKIAERNPYTGAATRYKAKHIVVWEAANGPVPPGHAIRFRDGDKLNCDIDNLVLVTLRLNAMLNRRGYTNVPQELKPVAFTTAVLEVRAFELAELTSNRI